MTRLLIAFMLLVVSIQARGNFPPMPTSIAHTSSTTNTTINTTTTTQTKKAPRKPVKRTDGYIYQITPTNMTWHVEQPFYLVEKRLDLSLGDWEFVEIIRTNTVSIDTIEDRKFYRVLRLDNNYMPIHYSPPLEYIP